MRRPLVSARDKPRSAIISTRSRKLSLKRRYHCTQRTIISRSKCRPLNSSLRPTGDFAISATLCRHSTHIIDHLKFAPEPRITSSWLAIYLHAWGPIKRHVDDRISRNCGTGISREHRRSFWGSQRPLWGAVEAITEKYCLRNKDASKQSVIGTGSAAPQAMGDVWKPPIGRHKKQGSSIKNKLTIHGNDLHSSVGKTNKRKKQ